MSKIQDIHSSGLSLLNNLIRDNNNIKIKVPSTANPAIFSQTIPFKAMVSGIDIADTKLDSNLTIDTKVCKLVITDLAKIANCPTRKNSRGCPCALFPPVAAMAGLQG